MASRVVFSSTVSVPVYVSWKCEACGEVNFAEGKIVYKVEGSSRDLRVSKLNETERRVSQKARNEWVVDAVRIIGDPNHSGAEMYNELRLQNTSCTKCKKKPRWDKKELPFALMVLCTLAALFSGYMLYTTPTAVVAWAVFLASVGLIAWSVIRKAVYKKMMRKLPKEYTPAIGSLNKDLKEHAASLGIEVPTPKECFAIAKGYKQAVSVFIPRDQTAVEKAEGEKKEQTSGDKRCELCDNCFDHLTYCEIKDDMGTRYRNLCDACIQKHSATPKK